jgi:hypothetical protein
MDPKGYIVDLNETAVDDFGSLMWYLAWVGFGKVRVIDGRRSLIEQTKLYGLGRTARDMSVANVPSVYAVPAAKIVTWTEPYNSRHVDGKAIDLYLGEYKADLYPALGMHIKRRGFVWGGDWNVRDYGHVELRR